MSLPPFPDPSTPLTNKQGVMLPVWARYFEAMHEQAEKRLMPAGGADGEALTKQSDEDHDADWETLP